MKTWRSPDGTTWAIDVDLAGSSNAMVLFRHPAGGTSRLDRYNWYISNGPEARSVTSHLSRSKVLDSLSDGDIATLYRRSMPVSRPDSLSSSWCERSERRMSSWWLRSNRRTCFSRRGHRDGFNDFEHESDEFERIERIDTRRQFVEFVLIRQIRVRMCWGLLGRVDLVPERHFNLHPILSNGRFRENLLRFTK